MSQHVGATLSLAADAPRAAQGGGGAPGRAWGGHERAGSTTQCTSQSAGVQHVAAWRGIGPRSYYL